MGTVPVAVWTAPPAERLAATEALLARYRRRQELWNELAASLLNDPGAPRWGLAAAHGAAGEALEQVIRAEETLKQLRAKVAC
jgi:hypothetical protein